VCVINVQVYNEVKYVVNATVVERYHIDAAARNAVDRMQMSVSHRHSLCSLIVITLRASKAAVQCIVIGPVCGFVCL